MAHKLPALLAGPGGCGRTFPVGKDTHERMEAHLVVCEKATRAVEQLRQFAVWLFVELKMVLEDPAIAADPSLEARRLVSKYVGLT
jgi:hypothetical protein